MALQAISNFVPGVDGLTGSAFDPTQNDSSRLFPLGMRVMVYNDVLFTWGEVIYARGVAAVTVGDACILVGGDNACVLLDDAGSATAETGALIGWALAATVASEYGWFQIAGRVTANVLTGFVTDGLIYAVTTAGSVDDSAGGGQVLNARSAGSVSGGQAVIDVFYASIAGQSAGQA